MKIVLLCLMVAPIIYFAMRQKKWYLYLLSAFACVLPEQFAVKLHDSLPLLSVFRVLILICFAFWVWDKWKTRKFRFPKSLIVFFALNLIISVVNLRYGISGEIKRMFLMVFERVLFAIMLMDMIDDRKEFLRCLDFVVMGSMVLSVIGIVQTVFKYDIASVMHLTETVASAQLASRMGLVRAFGTYNAISFGCHCAFMAFLILYRLYDTKSIWHGIAFALNIAALICTFTRSAWLCFGGVALVALVLFRGKLIRRMLPSLAMTLALVAVLCCIQPKLFSAFVETGKSSINTVIRILPDSVVSLIFPNNGTQQSNTSGTTEANKKLPGFELDEEFGKNASNPTYSRTAQWTAVAYMAQEGTLVFGYGYNALFRGRIHFFFDKWAAKWEPTTFLDVGIVALITEGGLVGAITHLGLLLFMLIVALRKKRPLKEKELDYSWLTLLLVPLYFLLNYLAAFLYAPVIWIFIGLFYTDRKLLDGQQPEPQPEPLPEQAQS